MQCEGFKSNLIVNFFDDEIDNDMDMVGLIQNLANPGGIMSCVNSLKAEGNDYYKCKKYELALEVYITALNFLVFAKPNNSEEDQKFCDLASSLCLNLAACGLKRHEYNQVEAVCSLLLCHQPNNVKGLFRRGMALMELHRFEEAYADLLRASFFEPENGDIRDKLKYVEGCFSLCKRRYCFDPLDMEITRNGKKIAADSDGTTAIEVAKTSDSRLISTAADVCHNEPLLNEVEMRQVENNAPACKAPVSMSRTTTTTTAPYAKKMDLHSFSNIKRRGTHLRISPTTYQNLLQGQEVSYYHPRLCSVVEIRTSSRTKMEGVSFQGLSEQVRNSSHHDRVDSTTSSKTNYATESFGDSTKQAAEIEVLSTISTLVDDRMDICLSSNKTLDENCDSGSKAVALSFHTNMDSHCIGVVSSVDSFTYSSHGQSTKLGPQRRPCENVCPSKNIRRLPRNIPYPSPNLFDCRYTTGTKRKCSTGHAAVCCSRTRMKFQRMRMKFT